MVRPKDLPQPVRNHKPHESLEDKQRATRAPGPGAYAGKGITIIDKSHLLGFFPKAARFKPEQLCPEDLRTAGERENMLDVPGPIYNPKIIDTTHTVIISRPTSACSRFAASDGGGDAARAPGPGDYDLTLKWGNKPVSFTQASRSSGAKALAGSCSPAPTTYNPSKPPIRIRSAGFSRSARSPSTGGGDEQKLGATVSEDAPPYASLAAIDNATKYIKLPFATVSFTKAPRFGKAAEKSNLGPGAYNIDSGFHVTSRSPKGGKFGSEKRMPGVRPQHSAGLVVPPNPQILSKFTTAPSIGFTKYSPERGVPNDADTEIPSAAYNPRYTQVDPAVANINLGVAGREATGQSAVAEAPAPSFVALPSTLGGPAISFTKGQRGTNALREAVRSGPGPAHYNPAPRRRPDSASGKSFTKGPRSDPSAVADEDVPGPKYNPDYTVTRAPVAVPVSFGTSKRPGLHSAGSDSSSGPCYNPSYAPVTKNPRSAVLYLTG